MSPQIKLSDALADLLGNFEPHVDIFDGVSLSQEGVQAIVQRLRVMAKMARAIEQEVQVLRVLEISRHTRINMDDLAIDAVMRGPGDREGNVIKPDFGRKS